MSSWLDKLPSAERQKVREKFRMSPAAYEKLRERVKGPEDLEREQLWNEAMAQLQFAMETEPAVRKAIKEQIHSDIESSGIESVCENAPSELQELLETGQFDVGVDAPSENEPDQIVIIPEGTVSEKLPINFSLSEQYVSQLESDE